MLAALLIVAQVASVAELVNPRPDGWVTDQARVLDADARAELNALAEGIYAERGVELAVVTVDSVPGTPKAFATELFNTWRIGDAQTNTGVLVLLVMSARRLEVETGTGIEAALPSAWLAEMQAERMVPRFKQKDFPGGLVAGVGAIVEHLRGAAGESLSTAPAGEYRDNGTVVPPGDPAATPTPPTPTRVPAPDPAVVTPPRDAGDGDGAPIGALVAGGLGLVGLGGGGALIARKRRRDRTCTACQPAQRMLALDEIADDAHLDRGQITEEQVGSVNYEVVVCPGCQLSRTIRHGKWFSGYDRCSGCSYKTSKSSSVTTVHATYDHGGEVQVTETCAHCGRCHTSTRHTARRTRPSTTSSFGSSSRSSFGGSSRSSGGGSFGGGRSRGGGAGSSW